MTEKRESGGGRNEFQRQRLHSLDAYRGLIMISLSFNGFGLAKTATNYIEHNSDSTFWQAVRYQFSHAGWVGCSLWDLIQAIYRVAPDLLAASLAQRNPTEVNRVAGCNAKRMPIWA